MNWKLIKVVSEDGEEMYQILEDDYYKLQELFKQAEETGTYPEEANTILNEYEPIRFPASISTCGDGWGWYDHTSINQLLGENNE